ncbi:hypothetical protein GCM10011581_22000 [Saccharopolyspora subtropica]|uniref:Uncharacterized protein n=1 Tax=Saccharopolyspora thermophila TaxID=89367 RepID=A0A917NAY9_9PSEU|nr:hypothetical protein [Saccharopolyspora subtropica]GGI84472.1 hypothetical protein GCM10011581_22000 [Saccharopolyspora subtropica]
MARVAITGHRGLPERTATLVEEALRASVRAVGADLVGVTCLADGADTLFARAVLDAGGRLEVVVPAARYRDALPDDHRPVFDALLAAAVRVVRLDHVQPTPQSYLDAGLRMLELSDELLAVWDGEPARGRGGTADIVEAARARGLPVTVLWPPGAHRVPPADG